MRSAVGAAGLGVLACCGLWSVPALAGVAVEIQNGSMTDGTETPAGWQCGAGPRVARDTTTFRSAPAAMRVLLDPAGSGNVTQDLAPAPGQSVTITGWDKSDAPGGALQQYQVAIQTWDENRQKIDWHEIVMRISWRDQMTHDWTEFRGTAQISARARSMSLVIYVNGTGTVWLDDIRVEGSPTSGARSPAAQAPAGAVEARRGEGTYFVRRSDKVIVLGDAVSADGGIYRLVLEDDFRSRYPDAAGRPAALVNAATAGATAADVLRSLPGLLAAHRPTVAVVCCGINDSFQDVAGFSSSMRGIVRALKDRGIAATLLTPPCMDANAHPELASRARTLDEMVGALRRLAAEERVDLADGYAAMKRHLEGGGAALDWGDGVHPNARGRRMMADALQETWGAGKPLAE